MTTNGSTLLALISWRAGLGLAITDAFGTSAGRACHVGNIDVCPHELMLKDHPEFPDESQAFLLIFV
jgi:hypothetical protein